MSNFNDTGINKKTYNLIIEDQKTETIYENDKKIYTIEFFTKLHKNNILNKINLLACSYYFNLDLLKIEQDKNQFIYKTPEKNIVVQKLSDTLTDKANIRELKTNKRYGQCHSASISLALAVEIQNECEVITGFVDECNNRIMHSIVEYNHNGLYVDYTKNLIISKEDYINIYNFKEIEKVSDSEIKEDMETIFSIIEKIGLKAYLCFRNEIINDLEKNHSITFNKKYLQKNMPKKIK